MGLILLSSITTGAKAAPAGPNNFYKSEDVSVQKVSFRNQYKMNVIGNLFLPENFNAATTYPAIVVGHPMGAVKEQSANLYAARMAERGFVTLWCSPLVGQ